jgi:hypothetical protein
MKKGFFTLFLLCAVKLGFAATYYWIGGLTATSFTSGNNWTTDPVNRTPVGGTLTIGTTDVFIFDGTNLGAAASPATGPATLTIGSLSSTPFAQLKMTNGANITINRSATGSGVINLNGDGTADPDLVVDATSSFTLGGPNYNYDYQLVMGANATGLIQGSVYLSPLSNSVHTRSYITVQGSNALVFDAGASCYITDSSASSGFNSSINRSIVFKGNASLYYYSGRSPIGSSTTVQFIDFQPGSNLYFRGNNAGYSSSSWVNSKVLANVFVQNNTTLTADGPAYKIENFTIDAGSTFITHSSGQTAVLGNLVVNGSITYPAGSSNSIVMGGSGTRTVSGSGTVDVPGFVVSEGTSVQLQKNVGIATNFITIGSVDFGTSQVTGAGAFTARAAAAAVTYSGGSITTGSYQITGLSGLSGIAGQTVTGPGIPANTVAIAFSASGGTVNLSQPATSDGTGTYSFATSTAATLATANTNGFDSTSGSVVCLGNKSFNSAVNYIFNAATVKPFNVSPYNSNGAGNVTANAAITLNKSVSVGGVLTLNTGRLTVPAGDTLTVGQVAGTTFNSSKYIALSRSGNSLGVLATTDISAVTLFPVGSAANYLPVTLTPAGAQSFVLSVFEGATSDGTPGGTALSAAQKASLVDAVWIINRVSGSGDCVTQVSWPASLEGSTFAGFTDAQVGIARYDGAAWTPFGGTGNNTANTVSATFSSFSPFLVGKSGEALAMSLRDFTASLNGSMVALRFVTYNEVNMLEYAVERSLDGRNFTTIATIAARNLLTPNSYTLADALPVKGIQYYRVKAKGKDGYLSYSNILRVNNTQGAATIAVYPNPAVNYITLSGLQPQDQVRIVSMTGAVVAQKLAGATVVTLEVSQLVNGSYIAEVIRAGAPVSTHRFSKQ